MLFGALEQGNAWLAVTTANARISIKHKDGRKVFFPSFLYDGQGRLLSCRIQHLSKISPTSFSGVVGQERIVQDIEKSNADKAGCSYGICFVVQRGTGKTCTAKIFARAINCLHPPDNGEPRAMCVVCVRQYWLDIVSM